jgi:hypothetical protein
MLNKFMGKKFDAVFESVIQRYQAGGFLTGDPVKFTASYKSSETYKGMPPHAKQELDELASSGLNIVVTQVGGKVSPASAGDQFRTANGTTITIAGDQGGGRHYGFVTVTPDMLELNDNGINLPAVPDQFKRKDKVIIKPQKVVNDPKNITRVTDKGNGTNTPTDLKLAGESTKLKKDNEALVSLYESTTQNL